MADPAGNIKDRLLNDLSSTMSPVTEDIGGGEPGPGFPTIPDHKLLRCIGRGSYGEVWLAQNALGTFRAVKIVRRQAFDSERPYEREFAGICRFEPISRSHPSQLNVLHVGRDDEAGLFYYVMEVADDAGTAGKPAANSFGGTNLIGDPGCYAPRTIRSDIQQRGRLACAECLDIGTALATALDHLHRHGLVHRDIKPSNIIFVNGIPKLADIGLVTRLEATLSFVGTEGYVPPEGPGTPQADIYSLGKVVYEMATGRDRQDYPELPTRLIEAPLEERRALAELNEVIVRACHPDAQQRYQTAAELHADLAVLQSGRSVMRMRAVERSFRFVRRAGAVVTVVALVIGAGWFWQARQTRSMRELAGRASRLATENGRLAQESRQVASFLKGMLAGVHPEVALGRDTTLLREILDSTAARVGIELKDHPKVEAELRTTLGGVYRSLGEYERSEVILREAMTIQRRLEPEGIELAEVLMELATTLQDSLDRAEVETWHRMLSPANEAKLAEAETLVHESLNIRRKITGDEHPDIAASLGTLASMAYDRGQFAEAEGLARRALDMANRTLPEGDPELTGGREILAIVLGAVGKFEEAETLYRESLTAQRSIHGTVHPAISTVLGNLAQLLQHQQRLAEAEACYQEAIEIERKLGRMEHPLGLARLLNSISQVLQRQGKLAEAEAALREALPLKTRLYGEHLETAAVLDNLGGVLAERREFEEAETLVQRALAMRKRVAGENHPHLAVSYMRLAELRELQHRPAEAEEALHVALGIERKLDRPERPYVPELNGSSRTVPLLIALARNLRQQNRAVEAEQALRQAFELLAKPIAGGPGPPTATLGFVLHHLAESCCELQKCEEARALCEEAVRLYNLHPAWPAGERSHSYRIYLAVVRKLGDRVAEQRVLREAIAAEVNRPAVLVAEYLGDLGGVYASQGRNQEAITAFREALQELKGISTAAAESEFAALLLHHLADVLWQEGSLTEARRFAEEAMALYRRNPRWPFSEQMHAGSVSRQIVRALGDHAAAEAICRELLQTAVDNRPAESPEVATSLAELTLTLLSTQKYTEAEGFARQCLNIREKQMPDDWRTANTRSMLGAALLGQKKYAEAEPLLLAGYQGMKTREALIPPVGKTRLKEAGLRILELYELTGAPAKAEEWRLINAR